MTETVLTASWVSGGLSSGRLLSTLNTAGFLGNEVRLPRRSQLPFTTMRSFPRECWPMPKMKPPGSTKEPESLFYGLGATGRKWMPNLIRDARIHLRRCILTCELSHTPENPATTFSVLHSYLQKELGHTATCSMIQWNNWIETGMSG